MLTQKLITVELDNKKIFSISVLIGFIYFLSFNCLYILNPADVIWLLRPTDIAQAFLGWLYFKETPFLQYPLGLNPDYAMLAGNSIIYTDSIPILALLFKYLRWFLPHPFQYFGWWMLTCIILQYYFAAKLLSTKITCNLTILLGALLFLFTDNLVLYFRIAGGQFSLASQFLILASLYFALREKFLFRHWLWLILLALLIHIYYACPVMTIFIFDLIGRVYKREMGVKSAFIFSAAALSASLAVMHASGYFSYALKDIQNTDFWGTNLFSLRIGLGATILLVLAIGLIIKEKSIFKQSIKTVPLFLALACVLLYIFSWGPNWQIAHHTILTLPQIPLYTIFRNMHRFALPLTYLVMFFALLIFSIKFGNKNKILVPILIGLVILQFYDHRKNYFKTKQVLKSSNRYLTDFGSYSTEILSKDNLICTGMMSKAAVDAVYLFAVNGKPSRCAFLARVTPFEQISVSYFAEKRNDKNSAYLIENVDDNAYSKELWDYLKANFKETEIVEVNGYHFFLPEE
jgi:hypothetical protein